MPKVTVAPIVSPDRQRAGGVCAHSVVVGTGPYRRPRWRTWPPKPSVRPSNSPPKWRPQLPDRRQTARTPTRHTPDTKKPRTLIVGSGPFRCLETSHGVSDGIRTHDIQDHNLAL